MKPDGLRDALCAALGRELRRRRKALGLTLAQVSGRAGVSLGYLSQVERGDNSPSVETLHLVAGALGTNVSRLTRCLRRVGRPREGQA